MPSILISGWGIVLSSKSNVVYVCPKNGAPRVPSSVPEEATAYVQTFSYSSMNSVKGTLNKISLPLNLKER